MTGLGWHTAPFTIARIHAILRVDALINVTSSGVELAILQELRSISQRLEHLEKCVPTVDRTWLTPTEMSKLCGVSPRTLQTYVSTGRIGAASYKREVRGKTFNYRYHRELALRDLGL